MVERVEVGPSTAHLRTAVPPDLRFFEGHFDGDPVLPGIAELLLLVHRRARELWGELGRERRITRLKFEQAIRPGDALDIHLDRSATDEETVVRFRIERGGQACATGAIAYAR